MNEKKIDIDRARQAKQKALELYGDLAIVNGIGISRVGGSYAVRINLRQAADADPGSTINKELAGIKSEIDGVPVLLRVVGEIHPQSGPKDGD